MTRGSVKEYLEAVELRYRKANRKEKGRLLDEFVQVTGYHRKAAIRLLCRRHQGTPTNRVGRPKEYGPKVIAGLKVAWEASDRSAPAGYNLCSQTWSRRWSGMGSFPWRMK